MGIFSAMISAVAGLRAQSYALENISGNIANSQTTGFKRVDTAFQDLISGDSGSIKRQNSGSVLGQSRATNSLQGGVATSGSATHMAVNGDGFFVVQEKIGEVDNKPIFSGVNIYSRRGDFDIDRNGYVVNGSGHYLMGLPLNPTTGNPTGGTPELIQLSNDFLPAVATTQIDYRANLPKHPKTNEKSSELLASALIGNDISATNESTFFDSSVSGSAVTAYDPSGAAVTMEMRWAKTSDSPNDTWNLYYLSDSEATTTGTKWTRVPQDFVFDNAGKLTSPTATNITMPSVSVNGTSMGDLLLEFGIGGLTQYDDNNGAVKATELTQDGSTTGRRQSVSVSDDGRFVLTYTNGRKIEVAEVPLAGFNAVNSLQRIGGGAFAATKESGDPILGASGSIAGEALEASNTDIADEFSKLIVTQQAYSANTRIVSTSDEMLSEALNMIR